MSYFSSRSKKFLCDSSIVQVVHVKQAGWKVLPKAVIIQAGSLILIFAMGHYSSMIKQVSEETSADNLFPFSLCLIDSKGKKGQGL